MRTFSHIAYARNANVPAVRSKASAFYQPLALDSLRVADPAGRMGDNLSWPIWSIRIEIPYADHGSERLSQGFSRSSRSVEKIG